VQCRHTDDRAFARSGHVLNTGGLSAGGIFRIAAEAWAGLSEPVVKEAEERALAGVVAMDVEESANALIKQLEDADRHSIRTFSILFLVSSFFVLLSDGNGVFPLEVTIELERLHAPVDAFLNFLGTR
jgi:hypothetical protein